MFPSLPPGEMLVILVIAVVLFGKKLPEVGRSLGKGIVEFKKGLRGVEDEFDVSSPASSSSRNEYARASDEDGMISVPKFEPPTMAPYSQPVHQDANAQAN